MNILSTTLADKMQRAVTLGANREKIVYNIEEALYLELQIRNSYRDKARLIHEFLETDHSVTLQSFCLKHNILPKTFTRNVLDYTGYNPQILRSIKRFQNIGNELITCHGRPMSDIAYENNFADQSHFIRNFRKFSGSAPCTFLAEKKSLKEHIKYNYL